MGRIFAGIVLALSFVVAAPAQAGVVRLADMDLEQMDPIFSFTYERTYNDETGAWDTSHDFSTLGMVALAGIGREYLTDGDSVVVPIYLKNGFSMGDYTDFAISLTTDDVNGDFLGFLAGLTFSVLNGPIDEQDSFLALSTPIGDEPVLNYFSGLANLLMLHGEIEVALPNNYVGQYTLTFYGVRSSEAVPEPATLALLGLGLAGLGLARCRKIVLGLALAVSLFMAVPAQADITRLVDMDDLDPIFSYTFEIDLTNPDNNSGLLRSIIKAPEGIEYRQQGVSLRTGLNTLQVWLTTDDIDMSGYTDFVITLTSTDSGEGLAGFFESLTFRTGTTVLPVEGAYVDGLGAFYVSGLADILPAANGERIEVIVGNSLVSQYVLTFSGVRRSNGSNEVPEPATLAVLGLGLAGLGLAGLRRKK